MLQITLMASLICTSGVPDAVPGAPMAASVPALLRHIAAQTDREIEIRKVEGRWAWIVRAKNWHDVRNWVQDCYQAYGEESQPKPAATTCGLRAMKALWAVPNRSSDLLGTSFLADLTERPQLPGKLRGLYLAQLLGAAVGHAQVVQRMIDGIVRPNEFLFDSVAMYLQQQKAFAGCRHKAILIGKLTTPDKYGRRGVMSARNAVEILTQNRCTGGEAELILLLASENADLRIAACRALGALRHRPARAALERLSKDDQYSLIVDCPPKTRCQVFPVREAAAAALKAL